MPNYQNGKIYALRSHQTDDVYIGSTTRDLNNRKANHMSSFKQGQKLTSRELCKYEDCYIELIEACPCDNKKELERREGQIIRETENCINRIVVGRTPKEYREENVEVLKERSLKYRNANKKVIKVKNKKRYEENKEDILKKNKEWNDNHKEKVKEYKKEWCQVNAEKLKEQHHKNYLKNKADRNAKNKAWYEANKAKQLAIQSAKYTCECGKTLTVGKKARHAKTQKHLDWVEENK